MCWCGPGPLDQTQNLLMLSGVGPRRVLKAAGGAGWWRGPLPVGVACVDPPPGMVLAGWTGHQATGLPPLRSGGSPQTAGLGEDTAPTAGIRRHGSWTAGDDPGRAATSGRRMMQARVSAGRGSVGVRGRPETSRKSSNTTTTAHPLDVAQLQAGAEMGGVELPVRQHKWGAWFLVGHSQNYRASEPEWALDGGTRVAGLVGHPVACPAASTICGWWDGSVLL